MVMVNAFWKLRGSTIGPNILNLGPVSISELVSIALWKNDMLGIGRYIGVYGVVYRCSKEFISGLFDSHFCRDLFIVSPHIAGFVGALPS